MEKRPLKLFVLFGALLCLSGCYITQNPFADINKLGTVLEPGYSVTLQSEIGPVTIEYVAPTKRRLIWNGEAREFGLRKSSQNMGVFADTEFEQGSVKNIYGVNYGERTITFRSEEELQKYLHTYPVFEHRADDQMIVCCRILEHASLFSKKKKRLSPIVIKYQITDEKDSAPPPWGYLYPVELNIK